ncbi:MAG: hypothetical protein LBT50_06480 [Prevotellaceae bacterium]|jgi:hypothetical protein|nr:hypothetical protein [Prevotellaceae bacterium]
MINLTKYTPVLTALTAQDLLDMKIQPPVQPVQSPPVQPPVQTFRKVKVLRWSKNSMAIDMCDEQGGISFGFKHIYCVMTGSHKNAYRIKIKYIDLLDNNAEAWMDRSSMDNILFFQQEILKKI